MKSTSTLTLVVILIALVGAYLGVSYLSSTKDQSKGLRDELVDFEPSQVDQYQIEKAGQTLLLTKEGEQWMVALPTGKTVPAVSDKVLSGLENLLKLKPERMITQKPEKHGEYGVSDSLGTRIVLRSKGDPLVDVVLGKFDMVDQSNIMSYARLTGDDAVYATLGFYPMGYTTQARDFRNQTLLNFVTDSISEIRISYPGDLAFTIRAVGGKRWTSGYDRLDSTAVNEYVRDLGFLRSSHFVDDQALPDVEPSQTVEIVMYNGESKYIYAYPSNEYTWLVTASDNATAIFDGGQGDLMSKAFKTLDDLMIQ